VATCDVQVGGVDIPAGSTLVNMLGAANRDDTRWTDPDRFDIFREYKPHVSFGQGPHMCLGQNLARIEMQVALDALFDRLPDLRLDPAGEDLHIRGHVFRSPSSLPVLFGSS
jgi:cytochrome P450